MISKPIVSLHFIYNLSFYGGGHRQLQVLADNTDPNKCQIILSSLTTAKNFELNSDKAIPIYGFDMEGKNIFYQISRLRSFVLSNKINVLNAYGTRCQFLAAIVGKITGVPVIAWEIGLLKYGSFFSQISDLLIEFIIDERCCNSQATLAARRMCLLKSRTFWSVLHLGIDDRNCFSGNIRLEQRKKIREFLNVSDNDILIATIGGFIRLRDHSTTILSLSKLKKQGIPLKLALIGEGELQNELEKLCVQEGIKDDIFFLGYIKDASEWLPGMDIYINGAYQEGFGFATVEAMLAGLPIIAANSGANPEVIEHKKTGLLVEPKSVEKLTSSILMILQDQELRLRISRTARKIALDKFAPEKFAKKHEELCIKVLNRRKYE